MYLLEIRDKTIFAKLIDVYPECSFLIEDSPQLYPLKCLVDYCPRNANCMEKLAHRVKWFFDTFPKAELLILYFAYRDRPGSTRAGLFWRNMQEPRFITLNRSSWNKLKGMGSIYEYTLPDSLLLGSAKTVVASQ